jgi:MFS family permease
LGAADHGDVATSSRFLTRSRLIAAMCLCEVLCMMGFATYPALLPRLTVEWGLSNAEAGLIGGVLFFAYALGVPFLTGLTDRIDSRRVYVVSCLVAGAGSAIFGWFADGLWIALLGQAVFGIGFAGIFMPGLKALSDRIDSARQSRAVALYTALSSTGLGASFALSGWIADQVGWRASFYAAAAGPLVAAAIAAFALEPREPQPDPRAVNLMRRFRLVLRNRPAVGYIIGYSAHCWELYGLRAWMVAFFAFVASRLPADMGTGWALMPTEIAGAIALVGMVTSIYCNELALRFHRTRVVLVVMMLSSPLAFVLGLVGAQALWLAIALGAIYYGVVMADSALLTAGTVAASVPEQRGATMALHSTLGFSAGLLAPVLFGIVLDLLARSGPWAWSFGFLALALPNLPAAWLLRRLAGKPAAQIRSA